jgi:hypothetical protein
MHWKQTWEATRARPNIAMVAVLVVSSTMLAGALQAQNLGMEREKMPPELEAMVKETVGQEVEAIITLEPIEHGQTVPRERLFVTEARDGNSAPVTRTVNLEQYSINLEVMPPELEAKVKQTVGQEVYGIITLGPGGQERRFLSASQFTNPPVWQQFPIEPVDRITSLNSSAFGGEGVLKWEASPDCQCRWYPGLNKCVPLPGHVC